MRRLTLLPLLVLALSFPMHADALVCDGQTCLQPNPMCCTVTAEEGPFCSTQAACDALNGTGAPTDSTDSPTSAENTSNNTTQTNNTTNTTGFANPLQVDSIEAFLALILAAAVRLGTIILVIMLVYVGFLFVVAQGNEEKISTAKTALMWTVIGGLVLLGAQAISIVIQSTVDSLR